MFRLVVFILALAMLPTGALAGPRPLAAAPFSTADNGGQPITSVSGKIGASTTAVSAKRCMRGALPSAFCKAEIGLPVAIVETTARAVKVGYEIASPTITGLSPGCLVGPPRSC